MSTRQRMIRIDSLSDNVHPSQVYGILT